MFKKSLITTALGGAIALSAFSASADLDVTFTPYSQYHVRDGGQLRTYNNYNDFRNHLRNNYSRDQLARARDNISNDSSLNLYRNFENAIKTNDLQKVQEYSTILNDIYGISDQDLSFARRLIHESDESGVDYIAASLEQGYNLEEILSTNIRLLDKLYAWQEANRRSNMPFEENDLVAIHERMADLLERHPTFGQYAEYFREYGEFPPNSGRHVLANIDELEALVVQATEKVVYINLNDEERFAGHINELDQEYLEIETEEELNSFENRIKLVQEKLDQRIAKLNADEKLSNASYEQPDTITTNGLLSTGNANNAVLISRMNSFNNTFKQITGLAAGEFSVPVGAWIKGSMSKGEQKTYKMEPGYKFNQTGITIGADVGDDFIFGAAYSLFSNNVDSVKKDDTKEKITTHIGAVYGIANLGNFYVSGQSQYGRSQINKRRFGGDSDKHVARGKTTGTMIGARLESGYNFLLKDLQLMITPSIGLQHSVANVKGYKETGSGLNRKIGNRSTSRTDAVVGLSVKKAITSGKFTIIPELHSYYTHTIGSKNSDTKIGLGKRDLKLNIKSQKLTDSQLEIGGTVGVLADKAIEVSAGYDLDLAKKFVAHTGSLKLRVNF